MKIKQLRLKDFGCFNSNRDFDFSDDLVIISGENYSGKTTIARAIYFLLADKVLTTGMKPKDIRAAGKGISTVGLIYENENHVYRTYRSTKGDIRNEIRERESWRSMDSTEPPLPKLNPEQWRIGCFLKEEELGEFLTRSPGNRRDLLNQILGVEQLLRAEETFIEARRISKRKAKLALSVQSGLTLDAFEDREADLEHFRRRIAVLRQKLAEPADMDSKHYLFKEWSSRQISIEDRIRKLSEHRVDLLAGFSDLDDIKETQTRIETALKERDACAAELEMIRERRILLTSDAQRIEHILADLSGLEGHDICPTCLQPVSSGYLSGVRRDYESEHRETTEKLLSVKEQERLFQDKMSTFDKLLKRESHLATIESQIQNIEDELKALQHELSSLRGKMTLSAVDVSPENLADQQKQHEDCLKDLTRLEREQALYEENRKRIADANSAAEVASRNQILCECAADAIRQTIEYITGNALNTAGSQVAGWLRDFGLIQKEVLSIDLEQSRLMPNLNERPFQALSGSEKVILYLGTKIALSGLMPGADFLVLDNPTAYLDNSRKRLLARYLMNVAPEKQVIVLTSDMEFASQFSSGRRIQI